MSQTHQEKSMDKKEIAEEEREKMLNVENSKHTGVTPVPDLESEEQKPKKIPIGGIKMPGFCRTKSKEPCKDDEAKPAKSTDAESASVVTKETEQKALSAEKPIIPVKDSKEKEGRRGILNSIRIPLMSSVFPRRKKEIDTELGQTGTAGLASVETLDDGASEKRPIVDEDGMETVRLDEEYGTDRIERPKHPLVVYLSTFRRHVVIPVTTLTILLISTIVIICIACTGPRRTTSIKVMKNDKYIEAVTSCGLVQGILEDNAYVFRGIPYAMPPVGNRRWQPAESLSRIEHCWNGTYLAHNSSKSCWQRDIHGHIDGDEDCLYLDVFTPTVGYNFPLSVVVMIGAETLNGGSPGVMQPSAKLAHIRDVVFVRPNFRMGIFGFLAVEPLTRATHPPTSGNYGLSDIIAALQWVQLNIENFGGNKSSVTLWGHRAGGTLATTLIGYRRAKSLFSQVWISSGSAIFPGRELNFSEDINRSFLDSIRCSDAACLRSKSAEELMDVVPATWYVGTVGLPEMKEDSSIYMKRRHEWLVLDGTIVQEHVGEILSQDNLMVKVVMGTTAHSGTPLQYLSSNVTLNATQVENLVRESLLGIRGYTYKALRHYNATLKGLITMISDIRVVCPLLTLARMNTNIPFYVVTQPRRQHLADPDSDAAAILGTYTAVTPEEKRYLLVMQQLFNQYVWNGQVALADRSGAKRILIVDQDVQLAQSYSNCDFWINENIVPKCGRVD
ncbi:neurotactin [Mycetomoellerius zeteki]|uniref:neurotactin n=1 Tax=Mycetomoellerius zeteki TaxID=64791 RepID=UPI00084E4F91|nr:PREDICTED: neurotactin [Trachymyrmex zeteki]